MDTNSTQQEILLITGTSFAAGQWTDSDETGIGDALDEREKLEIACWNGLLGEMLPELCQQPGTKPLYLWKILEGSSFLELDLGDCPMAKDGDFSIDPYLFLAAHCNN